MDSILVLIVMQIPTVAILFFAVYLFREVQKDRAALLSARETLENASVEGSGSMFSSDSASKLEQDIRVLRSDIGKLEAAIESNTISESDRDQIANQKKALKEFGRVLSKTSEQTYTEMQDMDQRISKLYRTLESNGFEIQRSDAA